MWTNGEFLSFWGGHLLSQQAPIGPMQVVCISPGLELPLVILSKGICKSGKVKG